MSYSIAGAGSASPVLGWGYWRDNEHTDASRQTVLADVRQRFTVNGLFPTTETRFLDGLPTNIWTNNTMTPDGVGNTYTIRVDYKASPNGVSQGEYCELDLDIGDGVTPINILSDRLDLTKGSGNTHKFTRTYQIFTLETFNLNGGAIYITPSVSVDIWDRAISIHRGNVV